MRVTFLHRYVVISFFLLSLPPSRPPSLSLSLSHSFEPPPKSPSGTAQRDAAIPRRRLHNGSVRASHVIRRISRTRTKRHSGFAQGRKRKRGHCGQACARARGGGGRATSGHARPRNIKDTPNAASCRSFVLAPLDVHAHLALALISTPRPRRCYPLRAIRFRDTMALSVQRARATRTKDHTPDTRTRSARLACILGIFSVFRRHRRPGGGVVGIDGPPPSRRALSLSLPLSFPSIALGPSVTVSFSLSPCVASPALSHGTVRVLLSFSYVFTATRRFGDSAIPERHARATLARAIPRGLFRGKRPLARAQGRTVLSLRAYARVLRSHAVDYTRALAHCTPPRRAAHARSRVRDQVRASDRAHIRGFAHSPPPPPPPPPPPRLALAPCIIRVHPSLAPPLRPQPLDAQNRPILFACTRRPSADVDRTHERGNALPHARRTYTHVARTQRDTAPLCVRARVRVQLCLTTSRAAREEVSVKDTRAPKDTRAIRTVVRE